MNVLRKTVLAATAAVLFGLGSSGNVFATAVLDFRDSDAAGTGTITDLGGGDWDGSGIGMDRLAAFNTPTGGGMTLYNLDGTVGCIGCTNGSAAELSFSTVTGSFQIVGSVPTLGIGQTTLLSGTISTVTVTTDAATTDLHFFGNDTKDRDLLIALGLDPNTPFQFGGFTIHMTGDGTPISVDIPNTAVPEPGTVLLFGSGLAGLGLWRKFKK